MAQQLLNHLLAQGAGGAIVVHGLVFEPHRLCDRGGSAISN
jgi:hypothetical protein